MMMMTTTRSSDPALVIVAVRARQKECLGHALISLRMKKSGGRGGLWTSFQIEWPLESGWWLPLAELKKGKRRV